MSLVNLVAFLEEGPWCATRIATHFPKHSGRVDHMPHPEPWAALWQAVRLQQYAQLLTTTRGAGDLAESLGKAAQRLYDDGDCPNIPWTALLHGLPHPPPPPPPWLEAVGHATSQIVIASRMGGEFGEQLRSVAGAVVLEHLGVRSLA